MKKIYTIRTCFFIKNKVSDDFVQTHYIDDKVFRSKLEKIFSAEMHGNHFLKKFSSFSDLYNVFNTIENRNDFNYFNFVLDSKNNKISIPFGFNWFGSQKWVDLTENNFRTLEVMVLLEDEKDMSFYEASKTLPQTEFIEMVKSQKIVDILN